jgi:hypothetical protein
VKWDACNFEFPIYVTSGVELGLACLTVVFKYQGPRNSRTISWSFGERVHESVKGHMFEFVRVSHLFRLHPFMLCSGGRTRMSFSSLKHHQSFLCPALRREMEMAEPGKNIYCHHEATVMLANAEPLTRPACSVCRATYGGWEWGEEQNVKNGQILCI